MNGFVHKMMLLIAILFFVANSATDARSEFWTRPRLGHFGRYHEADPISRIYELYFKDVLQVSDPFMKEIDRLDWRNSRPTPEICLNVLVSFSVQENTLSKPYDIIPLDACLDWLDDVSVHKQEDLDSMNSLQKSEFESIEKTTKTHLIHLLRNTSFKEQSIDSRVKEKVYEYLIKLLKLNRENPTSDCNALWLEAYNDFIENVYLIDCRDIDERRCVKFGQRRLGQDSYLNLIFESTRQAAKSCYESLQSEMREMQEEEFERSREKSSSSSSLAKRLTGRSDLVSRQSKELHLPKKLIGVLQLASGLSSDQPINLANVARDLLRVQKGDRKLVSRFTSNLGEFVMQMDYPATGGMKDDRNRFTKAIKKLCGPYVDSRQISPEQQEDPFEFYRLINSFVRMTKYSSIYKLSRATFEENVRENNWEALYLATFTCQLVSATFGQSDRNGSIFSVAFRPEASIMDWPIEVLADQLQERYPAKATGRSSGLFSMCSSSSACDAVAPQGAAEARRGSKQRRP